MGSILVNQFCDASHEWSRQTGQPQFAIPWYVMFFTGGHAFVERVGAVDPATLPEARRKRMTQVEIHGHHTIEQMEEWLQKMVDEWQVSAEFLIVSLVRIIEGRFEDRSENYAQGIANRRGFVEYLESIAADSEKQREYLARDREHPITEADFEVSIQRARKNAMPTLEEQREHRLIYDVWKTVTAPILEKENLDRAGFKQHFPSS